MRRRDTLHRTKVDEFVTWAKAEGYTVEQSKGIYEVFRLRNERKGELLIAHRRDGTDHVTTTGRLTSLVGRWLTMRRAVAA